MYVLVVSFDLDWKFTDISVFRGWTLDDFLQSWNVVYVVANSNFIQLIVPPTYGVEL